MKGHLIFFSPTLKHATINCREIKIHIFVDLVMAQIGAMLHRIENTQAFLYILIPSQNICLMLFGHCQKNVCVLVEFLLK